MTAPKYLALDLETTGLDPTRDRILEIATVGLDANLDSLGGWTTVVQAPAQALDGMDPYVKSMHLGTGLLEPNGVLCAVGKSVADAEEYLLQVIAVFPEPPILLGASVHFDRGFLRQWMPAAEAALHHRHLDATTVKLLHPGADWPAFEGVPHRAMADTLHAIAVLRHARTLIGGNQS